VKRVKDKNRKNVVKEYQRMIRLAIYKMENSGERLTSKQKLYLEGLKGSLEDAPYLLGYLHRPDKTKGR
jgi:hypothetical protein|tara:strand:- start:156 stop:362 length:207 start_codon:yes stop_codon:yes gene_type:complete